ncbi:MAG: TolC family protein [Acidobacteria bacterium]|nr:TolC family protein [Acidobacteriota bacterium]
MKLYYCIVVAAAVSARAEDLSTLVSEALARNPEVLAAQKRYEAARQRPDQESALPETMVSLGYNSSGKPYPGAGLGREPTSNIGMMVTQEFPFFGKRKLRGDIAEKEARAEYQAYQSARLAVTAKVKQAYFKLAYAELITGVLRRNQDLAEKLLKVAEIRYAVGKAAQQDVLKLQTQISILDTRRIQLDREIRTRQAELASLLYRRPADAPREAVMAKPVALARPLDSLLAMAGASAPMIRRDQHMVERSQLALNLARKDYMPDYAVTAGYFNMGTMPDMYQFRLDIKVPTSAFRKQHAAETEQAQRLVAARRTLEATAQSLSFRIQDDYLMAETSLRLMNAYENGVVPQASLTLDSALASYETGSVDLMSVLSNFITIVEYQMNYFEEMLSVYLAAARIEEMTGVDLLEGGGR